jgi:hypothetical protein
VNSVGLSKIIVPQINGFYIIFFYFFCLIEVERAFSIAGIFISK